MNDLKQFSTKELVKELETREGVASTTVEPYEDEQIDVEGPSVVLVITD